MEYGTGDSSKKDEAMKKTFESTADDSEKKKTKSKKKNTAITPSEKSAPDSAEKIDDSKPEKKVKSGLFEVLGLEKGSTENEKPPEKIEPSETLEAASQYVEINKPDAADELQDAQVGSAEEAVAAASVLFLEKLDQKLESSDEVDDILLEQAVAETLQSLDIQSDNIDDTDDIEAMSETEPLNDTEESDSELEEDDESDNSTSSSPPAPVVPPAPTAPRVPSSPNIAIPAPAMPPPNQPPAPPSPNVQSLNGPPRGPTSPNNPSLNPNLSGPGAPNTNPNIAGSQDAEFNQRRHRRADLLIGGVVGYLVGRRRGRINAERRLLPIQESLEKEVKQLHKKIADKELEVRRRAIAGLQTSPQLVEKRSEKIAKVRSKVEQISEKSEKEVVGLREVRQDHEEAADNFKVPETKSDRVELKSEKREQQVAKKTIETISLPLLLEIAADIKLDNVSLRTMFEKGVVDQKNLRKIVKRYMEGEKLEKIWPEALSKEIAGEELRHEVNAEHQPDSSALAAQPSASSSNDDVHSVFNKAETPLSAPFQETPTKPVENSQILDSILRDEMKEQKVSPAKLIGLMVAAVVAAVIIISIFS